MKKIFFVLFSGIIISVIGPDPVIGQTSDKALFAVAKSISPLNSFDDFFAYLGEKDKAVSKDGLKEAESTFEASKSKLKAVKANFRASEFFKKLFKDVADAQWRVEEQAIVASFVRDEVNTNVIFDKKGHWVHNLTYFPADKIPTEIRSIVEDNFINADLSLAVKIKEGGIEFYIVNIEDKRTIKQVSIYNGEVNVIKELQKCK